MFRRITLLQPDQVAVVTPSPQDYIQFQPGDVVGFYMSPASGVMTTDGVVALTSLAASVVSWCGMLTLHHLWPPLNMEIVPTQLGKMESWTLQYKVHPLSQFMLVGRVGTGAYAPGGNYDTITV